MRTDLLIFLLIFFALLGRFFDFLNHKRQKPKQIAFLTRICLKLDAWEIADYPKYAIRTVLKWITFSFREQKKIWVPLLLFSMTSVILTFVSYNLGYYAHSTPEFQSHIVFKHPAFFLINWVFDGLTILATFYIFSYAKSRPNFYLCFFVPLNLAIALIFSICCLASSTYFSQVITSQDHNTYSTFFPPRKLTDPSGVPPAAIRYLEPSPKSHFFTAYKTITSWVTTRKPPEIRGLLGYAINEGNYIYDNKQIRITEGSIVFLNSDYSLPMLLFSATTLIPTIIWLTIVSFLSLVKGTLMTFKWFACYVLEGQTESVYSYAPGTLIAYILDILIVILKLVFYIV